MRRFLLLALLAPACTDTDTEPAPLSHPCGATGWNDDTPYGTTEYAYELDANGQLVVERMFEDGSGVKTTRYRDGEMVSEVYENGYWSYEHVRVLEDGHPLRGTRRSPGWARQFDESWDWRTDENGTVHLRTYQLEELDGRATYVSAYSAGTSTGAMGYTRRPSLVPDADLGWTEFLGPYAYVGDPDGWTTEVAVFPDGERGVVTERLFTDDGRPLEAKRNNVWYSTDRGAVVTEAASTDTWTYDADGRLVRFHAGPVDHTGGSTIEYRYACE